MGEYINSLGVIRFFLAVSVVIGHLWPSPVFDCHRHAVFGFFCISGYLITKIRHENYARRPAAFALNRFLRIYPQYLVAIAFGGAMAWLLPEASQALNPALTWPTSAGEWAPQFLIFGLYGADVRLSPPTWSLNVELYFYVIIGALTFRSARIAFLALAVSLVPAALSFFNLLPNHIFYIFATEFYYSPVSNAFVFFMGAAAYFVSKKIALPAWAPFLALAAYLVNSFILPVYVTAQQPRDLLLVLTAVLASVIVAAPPRIRAASARQAAVAVFLGRMSYPMFLVHWAASVWLFSIIGLSNPALLLGGLATTLVLAAIMVLAIDLPVEALRRRIRRGAAPAELALAPAAKAG